MITNGFQSPGEINNRTSHLLKGSKSQFSVISTASREWLFESVHVEKLYKGQTLSKGRANMQKYLFY